MFDFVRKHTKIMMFLMFLLIIPAFVLVGVDGFRNIESAGEAVVTVGNESITQAAWDAAHKAEVDRVRASNPNVDVKTLDTPQARYRTLERLVHERLLAQAVQDGRIGTTDARLARELQQIPAIAQLRKPDGSLDMDRYRQLASSQGLTPEGFEARVRSQLALQQVENGVSASSFTAGVFADVALNAFLERREVRLTRFNAADYLAQVKPADADIEAYYRDHAKDFQAPETANVEYVVLDLDSVKKHISLNDADLKSYYDQNAERLSGKEERRASHILITAAKDLPGADRAAARARAQALRETLRKAPQTFAELARQNSQDPGSAPSGGDLNFFARGAMVKPFEEAAFALKKGDISEVVESDFGYHIIQLTDIKTPVQRSFEDLRPTLEADLKTQQAQRKFAEVAETFTNAVYEQSDSLKAVAESLKLELKSFDGLRREPQPGVKGGVLSNAKVLAAIFSPESLEKRRNTEAVEIAPNQLVAARVTQYQAAHTREFSEVKDMARARWMSKEAASLASKDGTKRLEEWRKQAPASLPAPTVVSRDARPGVPTAIMDAVLQADASQLPTWVGVDLGSQGYAVARIDAVLPRTPAPPEAQAQEQAQYSQWATGAERDAYYKWLAARYKVQYKVAAPPAASSSALTATVQ